MSRFVSLLHCFVPLPALRTAHTIVCYYIHSVAHFKLVVGHQKRLAYVTNLNLVVPIHAFGSRSRYRLPREVLTLASVCTIFMIVDTKWMTGPHHFDVSCLRQRRPDVMLWRLCQSLVTLVRKTARRCSCKKEALVVSVFGTVNVDHNCVYTHHFTLILHHNFFHASLYLSRNERLSQLSAD